MKTIGLIMASGSGKRFGSYIPKSFVSLNGKMVIQHVIDNMKNAEVFDEIYVVTLNEYTDYCKNLKNVKILFIESKSRIENGMQAINQLPEDTTYVLFQDSVRPFTPSSHFKSIVEQKQFTLNDFIITSQKITDALIEISDESVSSLDRESHRLGQTPEIVKFSSIKKCILNPNLDYEKVNSFAEFMIQNGFQGSECKLESFNYKITHPYDLPLSENLLRYSSPKKEEIDLTDKKILLFGGSGDIGKAIKDLCEEKGAKIIAPTHDGFDLLEILDNRIHKKFDCVIHAIGTYLTDNDPILENYDKVMDTNFWSVLRMINFCEEEWLKHGGNIIVLGSMAGFIGRKNISLYGASKSAIHNFIEAYQYKLLEQNIRINCIAPGKVRGKLQQTLNPSANQEEMIDPKDLAKIISNYILTDLTGQIVPVIYGNEK